MPDSPLVPVDGSAPLGLPVPRDAGRAPSSALVIVETEHGSVFASLRYARLRAFALEFLLDIVNTGDEPLLATTYAAGLTGGDVPVEPYSIWIEPRSEAYVHLRLPPLAALTCRAAVVRVQGTSVHQRLEARMPRPMLALGVLGGVLAAAATAFVLAALAPRASLAVAPSAATGNVVNARYAMRQSVRTTWELDDATDGRRLDGGTLSAQDGAFAIHVPFSSVDKAYVVRLHGDGRIGAADASAPLVAIAPPQPAAARISALSLDMPVVDDGGLVRVHYQTNASAGRVEAVDAQGTVWAEAPLSRSGSSVLQLPHFGRDKELQIRLTARRGATTVRAGVGMSVAVAPPPTAAPSTAPSAIAQTTPESVSTPPPNAGQVLSLTSNVARPGGLVLVKVSSHPANLRIALFSAQGVQLDERAVPRFSGGIAMLVPSSAQGTLTVVASYSIGNSEQSEVQRVTVVR